MSDSNKEIPKERLFKVAASTDSNKLAGSINASIEQYPDLKVTVRAIGAGSLNQAIKALIISNRAFSKKGNVAQFLPYFIDVPDNKNGTISAIELRMELRKI